MVYMYQPPGPEIEYDGINRDWKTLSSVDKLCYEMYAYAHQCNTCIVILPFVQEPVQFSLMIASFIYSAMFYVGAMSLIFSRKNYKP